MKSEIAILFWLSQGLQWYSVYRYIQWYDKRFRSYESFRVGGLYSATYGPIGLRLSPRFLVYQLVKFLGLTIWAARCVLRQNNNNNNNKNPNNYTRDSALRARTSRVTHVTLVLWVGNETLRSFHALGTPSAWPSLSPYRITPIHWLMARRRLWRNDVVRSYWRTRHPLLRFLCRKEPCRQREKLGSERSVSFPIQRTRVTWVTRDVLFHR